MFHWRNIVLPMLLLCCVSCSSLKKDPSQEAKEIYKRGKENMKKMSYKASWLEAGDITTTIYNKGNPDGTYCTRSESRSDDFSFLSIKNKDGEYNIYGDTALKANFQRTTEATEKDEHAEYSMANGYHKNIPCYVVTKKTEADEGKCASFIKSLSDVDDYSPEQLKELFENSFTATEICYIGKDDGFTYEHTCYNVYGQKRYSVSYNKVELNIPLDDKLFSIPANITVKVGNNYKEYNKIELELIDKELEPMLKKLRQQRMIREKLERAENASLIDQIKRVNRIYDIDRMKKYSGSNTYLCDYLGL